MDSNTKNFNWVPQAYFFDFEGTLVTFEWKLKEGIKTVLKQIELIGYPPYLFGENPSYVDIYNIASDISEKNNSKNIINIVSNVFDQFDNDALSRWKLYPDTKETLQKLKTKNVPLGLVSNVGSSAIASAIESLEISEIFDIVITRDEVNRLKPNPSGLLIATKSLKIDPRFILFTGDSYDDLGAAKAARIKSCYLSGGQDKINKFGKRKPDFIIQNLKELIYFSASRLE